MGMITKNKFINSSILIISLLGLLCCVSCEKFDSDNENDLKIRCIASGLQFAEGPTYYNGNLYFSDIDGNAIYRWNETDGGIIYKSDLVRPNGLFFNPQGLLYVCEGGNKQIVSIDGLKNISVITDSYNSKPYNEPNDLWVSPSGNIYFTDPNFTSSLTQDGQDVYCVLASTSEVVKVIDDLIKPNGIVGNSDGTILYVTDYGASEIYKFSISTDGSLTNRQLFAKVQADGLTIDDDGNLYAASKSIMIYSSTGELIRTIDLSGTLTNLFYVNENNLQLLYATTHNEVFQISL